MVFRPKEPTLANYIPLACCRRKAQEVSFFVMMLSRSRMKFVRFSTVPFTLPVQLIDALEEAFLSLGMPRGVKLCDQDRLFLVDENLGGSIAGFF